MSGVQKQLGCKYWFEAYLLKSTLDSAMWNKTLQAVLMHVGLGRMVKVVIRIDGNMVHYYFGANSDLSGLSNKLERVTLRPVDFEHVTPPAVSSQEWLVQAVAGGNILDIRERYELKRNKLLNWAIFSMRGVGSAVHTQASLLFEKSNGAYTMANKQLFATPGQLIAINFRENEKYDYMRRSKHLDIQKSLHMLRSNSQDAMFEVNTFPYLPKNAYLPLPTLFKENKVSRCEPTTFASELACLCLLESAGCT